MVRDVLKVPEDRMKRRLVKSTILQKNKIETRNEALDFTGQSARK